MTLVAGADSSSDALEVLEKAITEARLRSTELHAVNVLNPLNPPLAHLEVPIDLATYSS